MLQYPYSRCYVVESTASSGQVLQTSGFALSPTRVLTSNAHVVNIEQRPESLPLRDPIKLLIQMVLLPLPSTATRHPTWHLGVTMRMKRILVFVTVCCHG